MVWFVLLGVLVGTVFLCIGLIRSREKAHRLRSQIDMLEIELKHRLELMQGSRDEMESFQRLSDERLHTIHQLEIKLSNLQTETDQKQGFFEEKLRLFKDMEHKMEETFKSLSFDVLQKNNVNFLSLAKESMEKFHQKAEGDFEKKSQAITELFTPMKATLDKLSDGIQKVEVDRKGDHEAIKEQIKFMVDSERALKEETAQLVNALKSPTARGRWGEIQLKRVVEMAGMIAYCDFFEQVHDTNESGQVRPDMVIKLPSNKQVVVDAKTPFEAYFEAMQTPDNQLKEAKLKLHAKHLRGHVMQLGKKSYWETFQPSPEFVILFLPSETFFSAALEYDPSLIEVGVQHGVILATPITLIGLLKAIAYGWKQEVLSQHAKEISSIGMELYKRITQMHTYFSKLGNSLEKAVEEYNKTVSSIDSRVLVTARKFQKFGIGSDNEEGLKSNLIEKIPKVHHLSDLADSTSKSQEESPVG